MADPTPSFDEIYEVGKDEAQDIRPALVFGPGDQSTALVRAGAAMFDHVCGWFAGQIRAALFGGAQGDELDAIIMDRLQIPRDGTSPAYGSVTFVRSGSGSAGVISSGTQLKTPADATGLQSTYLTDYDVSYPSGAFSVTVTSTCALPGTTGDYSVTGDPVTVQIVDALSDATITASTTGFAGGNDVETDEHYLARAVTSILTQRRATLQALEAGALSVDGVSVANAVEDAATGIVSVKVADSSGESTLQMVQLVNAVLEQWRSAGVYASAEGMHASQLDLTISIVDYSDGFDVAAAHDAIEESVTNRIAGLKPGQYIALDELRVAIVSPYATQIKKVSFAYGEGLMSSGIVVDDVTLSPYNDIEPDDGRAIHLRSLTIYDAKALQW